MLKNEMWKGERCFIVGGGPSLKDFDWNLLEGEKWIGINAAWRNKIPTICYTHDQRVVDLFESQYRDEFNALPCRVHKHQNQVIAKKFEGIISYQGCKVWSKSLEQGLFNGSNSGLTAINLAEILGANPIYLLGFDMKDADGKNQYHDVYPPGWKQPSKVYQSFIMAFKRVRGFMKSEIYNCTPNSALDCFDYKPISEVFGS